MDNNGDDGQYFGTGVAGSPFKGDTGVGNVTEDGRTWRGGWDEGASYLEDDMVWFDYQTYICIKDHVSRRSAPPGDGCRIFWVKLREWQGWKNSQKEQNERQG
jgi:hypothetical protein